MRATTGRIRLIQRLIETFHVLSRGKPSPTPVKTWEQFASLLNEVLPTLRLVARPGKGGLRQVFRVDRLQDLLGLELLDRVTEGNRLRRCPECEALFIPGRANQKYCTHLCANRPNVRKWKKAQKRNREKA